MAELETVKKTSQSILLHEKICMKIINKSCIL